MANPKKGDVAFIAEGVSYTLRYSIDALCQLEAATGKSFAALAVDLQDPAKASITVSRQLLWAGLREHHPDVDLKTAGELMVKAGGVVKAMEQIGAALDAAFPKPDSEAGARPQQPGESQKDGTGTAS